jgi:hypothetical protein
MTSEEKSLERWHFELRSIGKKHWAALYESFLGVQPSSIPRLYKALNLYGYWPLFFSIIESSDRNLEGDPLNYVIAVAKNKWLESQKESDAETEYADTIEESKENTREANKKLERKIKKRAKDK